eukprot:CAMPEP_0184679508 /NCGR_PEP_ID=MMETSP0312-20130426/2351_1 /TAXON_ID=31354 /ORGANISM="Compsopogon coeruleus, Strain SAG 36.94" /LENGTH=164 /DNA_ID=CAMNT_0027129001 /DNA_START=162 /DNA_END=658 /DNA_ORIENTATION=-
MKFRVSLDFDAGVFYYEQILCDDSPSSRDVLENLISLNFAVPELSHSTDEDNGVEMTPCDNADERFMGSCLQSSVPAGHQEVNLDPEAFLTKKHVICHVVRPDNLGGFLGQAEEIHSPHPIGMENMNPNDYPHPHKDFLLHEMILNGSFGRLPPFDLTVHAYSQ